MTRCSPRGQSDLSNELTKIDELPDDDQFIAPYRKHFSATIGAPSSGRLASWLLISSSWRGPTANCRGRLTGAAEPQAAVQARRLAARKDRERPRVRALAEVAATNQGAGEVR